MEGKLRIGPALLAATALAACGAKETIEQPAPPAEESAAPADASGESAAPAPRVGADYFARVAGVWAAPGACGDYAQQWVIDATSINLHEMHCSADSVEETADGVRVTGNCSVEGDDDGVADSYELVLTEDGSLTIIQEGNGARYVGLTRCGATEL